MSSAKRMAGPDAAWLHMDRPDNLMVVNTILWSSRPIDWEVLLDGLQRRVIARFEGFRDRADDPPITLGLLGRPTWEPAAVDPGAHIRRVRLPGPGNDAALATYVAAEAARPLDPDRPLWELHLIDGYGDGSAVLLRTHHALADGRALTRVIELLTEPGPGSAPPETGPVSAAGAPSFEPGTWTDGRALGKLVTGIPQRAGALGGKLSGTKSVRWTPDVPLDALRRAAAARSATVNDLALAAVAGGLRRYLTGAGVPAEDVEVIVPVDLRPRNEPVPDELGNHFGLVFVPLPVDVAGADEQIARAKAAMDRVKVTSEAQMVFDAFVVLGRTPRASARRWVDAFARRASAIVTNIRGPGDRVLLGGSPLDGLVLLVPSTGPVGLGVSICSYAGSVRLGVISDDAVVVDPARLCHHLTTALGELVS
jgi:diacylglycerol O-acyltransferase